MKRNPKNLSLIIGLAIPIGMVVFIAIAINGPRWFNSADPPRYDFVYMTGQHAQSQSFVVEDGRIVVKKLANKDALPQPAETVRFFVHDIARNSSREIDLESAQQIVLDRSLRSPDGFTISPGRRGGWFVFGFGRDYSRRYIVKETFSQRLDLASDGNRYDYYWNFRFLGWVSNEQ